MVISGEDASGKITVFDNGLRVPKDANSYIGIHTADFTNIVDPKSVTVYRLGTDGLYLLDGSQNSEMLSGTSLSDLIRGRGGADKIRSGDGNDQVHVSGAAGTVIDAGAGFDKVFVSGTRAGTEANVAISNVERVNYSDGTLAFDVAGHAGQSYRVYQAAFDRVPDRGGLSFWVQQMDQGAPLLDIASGFLQSAEAKAKYGSNPSSGDFVQSLYQNVLGRAGESAGAAFWRNELDSGARSRANLLAEFAESPENTALVAPKIQGGIWLDVIA